jgi:nitroimidazol reductase NimA-like FMN-containing flavoprotein (pyridoxamine 5'-phosphate oxidase superfamily)
MAVRRTDVDPGEVLARPLVARVATADGRIRPVWFLWEDGALWWLTGSWSRLPEQLDADPVVTVLVDTCDLATGEVLQVVMRGRAEVVAFDADRARRKLRRYLGPDEATWDPRFAVSTLVEEDDAALVRLVPDRLVTRDLSFVPSPSAPR